MVGEKKGGLKKGRIMPFDHRMKDHFTLHEGLVLWLALIMCFQQVIPFPITLQQPKAAAALSPCSSSSAAPDALSIR